MIRPKYRLDQYKLVYGKYPDYSIEDERHFQEFCKLLDDYSLDDIIQSVQSPITRVNQVVGIKTHYYDINDVTADLLISHLKLIHEKWNIPIPDIGWWPKGIMAQAKGMIRDYSKEELHHYMHKLENDNWYREHITDPFTFKLVRKYIDKEK